MADQMSYMCVTICLFIGLGEFTAVLWLNGSSTHRDMTTAAAVVFLTCCVLLQGQHVIFSPSFLRK